MRQSTQILLSVALLLALEVPGFQVPAPSLVSITARKHRGGSPRAPARAAASVGEEGGSRVAAVTNSNRARGVSRSQATLQLTSLFGLGLLSTAAVARVPSASAAQPATDPAAQAPAKLWISGKSLKPKGSKDKTGTKKDSSYLRCLSDCTSECRRPSQERKESGAECLERCRDYCCSSYETCSYNLVPE